MKKPENSIEELLQHWPDEEPIEDKDFSYQLMARLKYRELILSVMFNVSLIICAVLFSLLCVAVVNANILNEMILSFYHGIAIVISVLIFVSLWLDMEWSDLSG